MKLKIHHFLFSFYYKRVPKFFHQWTFFESIKMLASNYEHNMKMYEGMMDVSRKSSERERQMQAEISNLKLKLAAIPQSLLDQVNTTFGTDLKGVSNEEKNN